MLFITLQPWNGLNIFFVDIYFKHILLLIMTYVYPSNSMSKTVKHYKTSYSSNSSKVKWQLLKLFILSYYYTLWKCAIWCTTIVEWKIQYSNWSRKARKNCYFRCSLQIKTQKLIYLYLCQPIGVWSMLSWI